MTPESWWKRRAGCAKALMLGSFANGMGSMDRVEPRLAAALGDILARPGSMVRAITAYLVGIEMGAPEEAARAVACGIEYLHTASLVFDDLPAMDDARTRRGVPCPHVAHGEAVAMLAALALINRGYAMIWQGIRRTSNERREIAGDWVDARLGTRGVIGGQAFDLQGWRGEQSPAEVSEVAARKTGDLLRLTLVLPALIGHGTEREIQLLDRIGLLRLTLVLPALIGHGTEREIQLLDRIGLLRGLAYQAADDLKDVICSQEESGKTVGRDQEMGRPNLILAEGFQAALRRFKRLRQIGDRVQAALPGSPERWGMLAPLRVTLPTNPRMVSLEAVRAAS